jgi:molybdate transport system substrate-binding protein
MSTHAALEMIAHGAGADMAILTREATETLIQQGVILNGSVADIAQSGIGVAVRAGTKKPDISTATAFRNAMLEAKSVAFSRVGASGLHFAEVVERRKRPFVPTLCAAG